MPTYYQLDNRNKIHQNKIQTFQENALENVACLQNFGDFASNLSGVVENKLIFKSDA